MTAAFPGYFHSYIISVALYPSNFAICRVFHLENYHHYLYLLLTTVNDQGPVVQSISSTSSLVVKNLTILVSTISNTCYCKCKSYSHFFCKKIEFFAIFNDESFNYTLTNDSVSF